MRFCSIFSLLSFFVLGVGVASKELDTARGDSAGSVAAEAIVPEKFYNINPNFLKEIFPEATIPSLSPASASYKKFQKLATTNELHVFAFNVGQGNCILLRCGKEIVFIDVGKGRVFSADVFKKQVLPKIIALTRGTTLKAIFITHPHKDHYSLLNNSFLDILKEKEVSIPKNTQFFLGGPKEAWKGVLNGVDKNLINIDNIFFKPIYITNHSSRVIVPPLLQDVQFEFLLPWELTYNQYNLNECSFLLKVVHKNNPSCSFLFTGDAEGKSISNAIGVIEQKGIMGLLEAEAFALDSSFSRKPSMASSSTIARSSLKSPTKLHQIPTASLQPAKTTAELSPEELYKKNRDALNGIGCVFWPHHGTDTENSQRVITYLSDRPIPPGCFIVSSIVVSSSWIPRRSSWEIVSRLIEHPAHFVTYSSEVHGEKCKRLKLTKKRFYVTEAAPGGVYWLMSDGMDIYFYDAYRIAPTNPASQDYGFFSITQVKKIDKIPDKISSGPFYTIPGYLSNTVKSCSNLKEFTPRRLDKKYDDLKGGTTSLPSIHRSIS